jgi:hypothetical protein
MFLALMALLPHVPPNQDRPSINNIHCYWAILEIAENIIKSSVDIDKFVWLSTIDPLQIRFKLQKLKIKHAIKRLLVVNLHRIT